MKGRWIVIGVCCGVLVLSGLWHALGSSGVPANCTEVAYELNITPDYSGVAISPNITPLNFRILEKGQVYRVRVHSQRGARIDLVS